MRHSCMELRWSDHSFHDRSVRDQLCLHPIHRETKKTEGTRLRRLNRPHRRHLIWMAMSADLRQKCAKDTARPHPSKDSTTNPSTGRRGFVISGAVADVHGWSKDQRALQLVSYLDETAMNVAQELGDNDLYNYDVLAKLLSDRFDPASRVSAFRSRFHGRSRRHHEDADTFADALSELGQVGYPQSPPEMRQELIAEQFVRGQSDPELKKYLW